MISTYRPNTLHTLPRTSPWGIYIVQSRTNPELFRIGASGLKAPVWTRLNCHGGGPPRERKNPPNWTELNRPWQIVWVAHLESATETGVLSAEHYLCGHFAQRYPFVSESGFKADPSDGPAIADTAEATISNIIDIIRVQTEPLFKKESKTGDRWRAK